MGPAQAVTRRECAPTARTAACDDRRPQCQGLRSAVHSEDGFWIGAGGGCQHPAEEADHDQEVERRVAPRAATRPSREPCSASGTNVPALRQPSLQRVASEHHAGDR